MQPILADLGPITLYSYGVFIAVGFLVGGYVTYRLARQRGLQTDAFIDYFLYAAVAGLLGARLWQVAFKPSGIDSFWQLFSLWGGGLSLYGGLLAAGIVLLIALRRHRQPLWQWFDVIAIGSLVGLAVGKFGSFLNGDSFGRSSKLPWAVQFNDPLAPGYIMGVPLHPTQLYAMFGYALAAVVVWQVSKRYRAGTAALAGLASVAIVQLLVEIWHAPIDALYVNKNWRVSVIVSVVVLMATIAIFVRRRVRA